MVKHYSRSKLFKLATTALPLFSLSQASVLGDRDYGKSCRCLPGDSCWPSQSDWQQLNKTISGNLIANTPIAAACHDPTYDAKQCAFLKDQWASPRVHYSSPSSIMSPIFLNQSCDPFTPEPSPCEIGNYAEYSINVTGPSDIAAGLKFAQEKNIRLVIKNTGHDYLGKSTGKGSLSLWTHNLKSLAVQDYNSTGYTGKSVRMGAGVQAFEAYTFVEQHNLRIVGGECATVGLAGGYMQGGGHSLLSSAHGLAADNTLEWEVVTADGRHLVATPTQNQDLYWALSGGGGGTYAVVLSVTTKAFPDGMVSSAAIAFNTSTMSLDTYWELIGLWHAALPPIVDAGAMVVYNLTNTSFALSPLTLPDKNKDDVAHALAPFISELNQRHITYTYTLDSFPNFLGHYAHYFGPLPEGIYTVAQVTGGRLVPRSVVQRNNTALTSALRKMLGDGEFYIGGLALNVAHSVANNRPGSNAVLPAWRDALLDMLIVGTWDFNEPFADMVKVEERMTGEIVPEITAVTPGSGTYLSEGDYHLRTWKEDFYGENYEQLSSVKRKYDPQDLFYATTAVGSDTWAVSGDGRLCRV